MKKHSNILTLAILVAIASVWFYFSGGSTILIPSYISVISDSRANEYVGNPSYVTPTNLVPFNLDTIPNLQVYMPGQKLFDARPTDNKYAFLDFNYLTEIRLINLQTGKIESTSFPEKPTYGMGHIWVGDQMLIHYFHGIRSNDPSEVLRNDHFYFFNPDTRIFTPIQVDWETSKYSSAVNSVDFLKKSDNSTTFAVAACSGHTPFGFCNRYGISMSDGISIKKMIDLKEDFHWGWKGDDFFIKTEDKVYLTSPSKIPF